MTRVFYRMGVPNYVRMGVPNYVPNYVYRMGVPNYVPDLTFEKELSKTLFTPLNYLIIVLTI